MKKRKHAEHLLDILGDLDERYLKEAESALEKMPVKQSIEEQKRKEIKWLIPCATVLLYLCLFGGVLWVAKAEENRRNEYEEILNRIEKMESEDKMETNQVVKKKPLVVGSKEYNYQKYIMNADHVAGCHARIIEVRGCHENNELRTFGYYHFYEMTADGPVYCRVTQTCKMHDIYCAGCGVYICSEFRKCTEEHERCGITESGFCCN